MLIGLVTMSELGLTSIVFYLVVSVFTSFLAFLLIDLAAHRQTQSEDKTEDITRFALSNFKGLGKLNPFWGVLLTLVMISLAGLPPTAGFFAKLNIFSALWEAYQLSGKQVLLFLFAFGLLNTAISLYFYLKLPFLIFFKDSEDSQSFTLSLPQAVFAILLAIPVLGLFFKADWLMNLIGQLKS